jgi:hypothetical protein
MQHKAMIRANWPARENRPVRQTRVGLYVHMIEHIQQADVQREIHHDTHCALLVMVTEIGERATEEAATDHGCGN